jgi:hypothetical protein
MPASSVGPLTIRAGVTFGLQQKACSRLT